MFSIGVLNFEDNKMLSRNYKNQQGVKLLSIEDAKQLDEVRGLIIYGHSEKGLKNLLINSKIIERAREIFKKGIPIFGIGTGLLTISKNKQIGMYNMPQLLNITVNYSSTSRTDKLVKESIIIPALGKDKISIYPLNTISIIDVGPNVGILATQGDEIVMVRQGNYLGSSFYFDIMDDNNNNILNYFFSMVRDYCKYNREY
ncbi:MAG: hypothetical protein CVU87_07800 [Firmicutes bacterium HGW-Firmicutes-12]|jgi:glutamine amidotransferase PdxT|nr:MAG: hypothetical protein CVU87_07800 [Firmicutes bacterium HGW-Firmicutes-12]